MTELEFENSFITHTPGCETPFEIILGDEYFGNHSISATDAKRIADFIYENLGLK